jgi:hypothetical protein
MEFSAGFLNALALPNTTIFMDLFQVLKSGNPVLRQAQNHSGEYSLISRADGYLVVSPFTHRSFAMLEVATYLQCEHFILKEGNVVLSLFPHTKSWTCLFRFTAGEGVVTLMVAFTQSKPEELALKLKYFSESNGDEEGSSSEAMFSVVATMVDIRVETPRWSNVVFEVVTTHELNFVPIEAWRFLQEVLGFIPSEAHKNTGGQKQGCVLGSHQLAKLREKIIDYWRVWSVVRAHISAIEPFLNPVMLQLIDMMQKSGIKGTAVLVENICS